MPKRKRTDGTSTRPLLPVCAQRGCDGVTKTLGGGTKGKYRYQCLKCGERFQQEPPYTEEDRSIARKNAGNSSLYRCGLCGQLKAGHVCTAVGRPGNAQLDRDDDDDNDGAVDQPLANAALLALLSGNPSMLP